MVLVKPVNSYSFQGYTFLVDEVEVDFSYQNQV